MGYFDAPTLSLQDGNGLADYGADTSTGLTGPINTRTNNAPTSAAVDTNPARDAGAGSSWQGLFGDFLKIGGEVESAFLKYQNNTNANDLSKQSLKLKAAQDSAAATAAAGNRRLWLYIAGGGLLLVLAIFLLRGRK